MAVLSRLRHLAMRIIDGVHGISDADDEAVRIIRRVEPYTMTTHERLFGLIQAVRYIERTGIAGAVVECGVWRGGSMMAAAFALKAMQSVSRDLFLFDTYAGMTEPTEKDTDMRGVSALGRFKRSKGRVDGSSWCYASIEDVRANLIATGYEARLMHFVRGKVEDTIPAEAPNSIALLRLDTDWYESTRHEFEHLYPRLTRGGVLIIDDYGYWQGSQRATDEYLSAHGVRLFLHRLDRTSRIAIKP